MGNWKSLDGQTVKMIKLLSKLGNDRKKIAEVVCRSLSTVDRVLKSEYDDNGTYIGPQRAGFPGGKPNQDTHACTVDLEWLKDVMVKLLYESCMTNNLLKQLIEKWK